jgi:hypothetical protein
MTGVRTERDRDFAFRVVLTDGIQSSYGVFTKVSFSGVQAVGA